MTDSMIERVARAIADEMATWDQADAADMEREGWASVARAAIAAMHEPTYWIPMTDAALEPPNGPARRDPAQGGYPAAPETGDPVAGR